MPNHKYDIILSAVIEIGGVYEAETLEEAIAEARSELQRHGQVVTEPNVERQVMLDDE